jgi:uncharacterized protein HemY
MVMVVIPPSIASADLISDVQLNTVKTECSTEILESLEKFVEDMGSTADAYTTLGCRYLKCGNYSLAKERYNKAIELAESGSIAELVARYGLGEIGFKLDNTDNNERDTLSNEIQNRLSGPKLCNECGSRGRCTRGCCIECP